MQMKTKTETNLVRFPFAGTRTLQGDPLVSVDAGAVAGAGLNCYELATLLLYYSTIPERRWVPQANTYDEYDEYLVETWSWGGLSQSESDSLMSNAKRMGMSTAS